MAKLELSTTFLKEIIGNGSLISGLLENDSISLTTIRTTYCSKKIINRICKKTLLVAIFLEFFSMSLN